MAKKKHKCGKCGAELGSKGWLTRHMEREHPYIPPAPPKVTIESMPTFVSTESHRLLGAVGKVQLGDVVIITNKFVVRRTQETEGSNTLTTELEKVTGSWAKQ